MQKLLSFLADSERCFVNFIRVAIFNVMAWIVGLKLCQYQTDGIVPYVTNIPLMSIIYNK